MREYRKQAKILQAMSHPVRLQILDILAQRPNCVCDLVTQTRQRQAYISQHLMALRQAGMVRSTRLGVNIQYELAQPETIKNMLNCLLQDIESKSSSEGETKMSNTPNNNAWHGIPREQINWHPTIVADRCVGCGLCATSCGRGVYAFDYEANKPVVVTPQMCMVGCTTCATLCTQDAIEFPSTGYIRQVIRKKKLITQSKNMLRAEPDKYDVKKRTPVAG
jgi:DNA-binding transcriptional ArsR family regulator/NAD-dependent dihydropyrimidine dehydrogenase PreA subunit